MNAIHLYTVAQMREAEQRAVTECGIPLAELMDNAGKGLARAALEMCPDGAIGIFCGNGNNGGDGYVCATELLRQGRRITVWDIGAESLPGSSKNAADAYLAAGGGILPVTPELTVDDIKCNLIVDALLGTGLTRQVSGLYTRVIGLINSAPALVLACDLPSGVDADTGQIMGIAMQADKTLMMGLGKLACALPSGSTCFGVLEVCDIGLPPELVAKFEPVRIYAFSAVIQKVPDQDGAYVAFPYDLRAEFGKGRVKVHVTFDDEPYDGSIVNMGVKNPDGSVCYIIGVRKDIRAKISKQPGDTVRVTIRERE
jgi:hydroxyethylthiazole kinase-like uncharacterized protein yjeF